MDNGLLDDELDDIIEKPSSSKVKVKISNLLIHQIYSNLNYF